MSVYDQIAEAARRKPGYVDTTGLARTVAGPKPRFNPTPSVGSGSGRVTVPAPPKGGALERLRAEAAPVETGGGGFNPLGAIGRGVGTAFNTVLNVADSPRRLYQGVAGEIGDIVESIPGNTPIETLVNTLAGNPFQLRGLEDEEGNRDTSFDLGEIRRSVTGDNAMSQGFMGRSTWDDDLPGFLRPVAGIAGDLATDPLTYLTAGTASGLKAGGISAARQTLAQDVALALSKGAGREVAGEVGTKLIREAGTRGRGAFTRQGLERVGATADDLAKLAMQPDFGLRVGVGSAQKTIPGTARIAEKAEDLKGLIKKTTGSSRAGRLSRELFTTQKHGENVLKQTILSGAPDAPTAARGLALLGVAKGDSFRWLDQASNVLADIKVDGKTLRRLSDDESKLLTHALEAGDMNSPLVREVRDFFEKAASDLQAQGVTFNTRSNYVPHRLSEKARRMLLAGDEDVRSAVIDDTIDKPEIFQKVRQSDSSIAEINAEWRKTHDYDLLEDDFKTLASQYLQEGQEAVMKSKLTGRMAEELGLVTDLGKRVDTDKVGKAIDQLAAKEAENITASIRLRRSALSKAIGIRKRSVAESSAQAAKVKGELAKAETAATRARTNLADAERRLLVQQENATLTADLARTARAGEKAAATRRANEAAAKLAQAQKNVDSARTQLGSAENRLGRWAEDVRVAEEQFAGFEKDLTELRLERKALDENPVAKDAVQAQQVADKAAVKAQQQAEKFAKAQSDTQVAESTAQWLAVDAGRAADSVTAQLAEFEDWMKRVDSTKGRRKAGTEAQREQRDVMRQAMSDIRDALKRSNDPATEQFLKLEAQAIKADAAAMMAGLERGRLQSELASGVDLLSNPRFQKYIVDQTSEGMERLARHLGPDQQINSWYREAIEKQKHFAENPSAAFRGAQQVMRKYMGAMNWWKGWALSSPGFVVRNLYSGMFGMYLDDVNPAVAGRFWRYLKQVEKNGPEAAQEWARRTYKSDEIARQLDEAHTVAAASGWGITANEAARDLTGNKVSLNPLSSNNPLSFAMRYGGQEGEAFLRGGHAYAVLARGGTIQDALQRVEKFHFNYRDISDFDRAMKNVMPFWTFWSRNIGLQASVFAKKPQKITRSYYNAKRNIEDGGEDFDVPVPWYLQNDMAGIATGLGSPEGRGEAFLTPDIPSVRFPGQMSQLADDPFGELMSQMGPGIKIPAQLAANKDFFTGRQYRNDLTAYDSSGEVPRLAPSPLQLPGVRNIVDLLPGTELIDNQLLMQDNVEAAIEGLNPQLNRTARLVPNNERDRETWRQYWINWLGGPIRWNDPGSQAGAAAAGEKAAENAAAKVQERIRLENLVRGG